MTTPEQPKKITELTPEQEAMLEVVREEWLAHGLSTQPANRPEAEAAVRKAYESAGLVPPKHYIWVGSPYAGALALGIVPQAITAAQDLVQQALQVAIDNPTTPLELKNFQTPALTIDAETVRDWWRNSTYGQHSAGYYAYLDAMERLGVTGLEPIHGSMEVAKNAGWWWPAEEFVIITERPSELHRDQQLRLHHEDRAAILYPDGFAVYAWHGTRVPRDLILDKWTSADIMREPNTEIRRCAIEKMGWDRFIAEAKLSQIGKDVPDPGNPGHMLSLYDVPERIYGTPVRILLCDNATPERDGTRRRFGLTVPADIKDPLSAAAWTFNMSKKQYAQIVHAY